MAYPTFDQDTDSAVSYEDGRVAYRSEGGAMMGSVLYDALKPSFVVRHTLQTSDVQTLIQFYEDNPVDPFDFVWDLDGQTYSVVFGPAGLRVQPGSVWHKVSVELKVV